MKKLDYTNMAGGIAGLGLVLAGCAMLGGAYSFLNASFRDGYYGSVLLFASGISLLCVSAMLGTVSEISHNIAALGKQTNPEPPPQTTDVQPDTALRKSGIPEVVSGNRITNK